MLATQAPEFETPLGALSSLNLGGYDSVIADLRRKTAEREAAKQRVLGVADKFREAITLVLARLPQLEARSLAAEFRQLDVAERALWDGIPPKDIEKLPERFKDNAEKLVELKRAVSRATSKLCPEVQKLDAGIAANLRRLLNELGHIARRLEIHYQHMAARAESLVVRARAPLSGPVKRAYELYKTAFTSVNGVRGIGNVFPDLRHTPPLYELPIVIDPTIFGNRRCLRDLERAAHEFVEKHDPAAVGAFTFRFELALGAA